jgi:hypothetical protein
MADEARAFSSTPTLETQKPIDRLTADDFLVFPIWEFATDEEHLEGRDETWVRPVDARIVKKGRWSLSVAADFCTRAGLTIPGFIDVTTAERIALGVGVLLPEGKYVVVDASSAEARLATARALGKTVRDVFPLAFRLRVPVGRERRLRTGAFE